MCSFSLDFIHDGIGTGAIVEQFVDGRGRVYLLEANPNPNLAYGEDFAESAEVSGMSYEALLDRILRLGLRWEPERT